MRKNFKIVEDKPPPLPEYGPGYTQLKVPKNFNPVSIVLCRLNKLQKLLRTNIKNIKPVSLKTPMDI